MREKELCLWCMKEISEIRTTCPNCGHSRDIHNPNQCIQPKTILNEKYFVGRVIGEGGFGITYIAYDLVLETRVAIKEYYPTHLVSRDTSSGIQTSLSVLTGSHEEQYHKGLKRFVKEAENLAKFNNLSGIVSVRDFFYVNNTAYMVMEYIEGITLKEYLKQKGVKLPYQTVLEMMKPVTKSLQTVHNAGIIHRDISPDNIMMQMSGTTPELKLIDFGAARFVGNDDEKSLTVILKHGYAPPEQYQTKGNQGSWTDVYALSATIYRMITGKIPQEAPDRLLRGDRVKSPSSLVPDIKKSVSDAIMRGLEPDSNKRTQSMNALFRDLSGEGGSKKTLPIVIACAAVAMVICAILVLGILGKDKKAESESVKNTVETTDESVVAEVETDNQKEEPPIEEKSESPEYVAYKKYFLDKYRITDEDDYYIYFFDVEHRGMDDMIVVTPIYNTNNPECVQYYDLDVVSYRSGEAKSIYKKRCTNYHGLFDDYEQLMNGEMYRDMLIIKRKTDYYFGAKEADYIKTTHNDVFGTHYSYRQVGNRYRLFSLDENGNEITLEEIKFDEWSEGYPSNELPSDLSYGIHLCTTNLQMIEDGMARGGIDMAFNHSYRQMLQDFEYERVKEYERRAMEISETSTELLTDIAFVDLDFDDEVEIVQGYSRPGVGWDNTTMGNHYHTFVLDDGEQIEIDSFWVFDYSLSVSIVQFGKMNSVLVGRPGSHQSSGYHTNLVSWSQSTSSYNSLVVYDDEFGMGVDSDLRLSADRYGGVYVLAQGEMSDKTPYPDYEKHSRFYIGYLNDGYIEYDAVDISYQDIQKIDNYQTAMDEAENYIKNNTGGYEYVQDKRVQFLNALYSSNDMIYINYELILPGVEQYSFEDGHASIFVTAVFGLKNGVMEFYRCEMDKRPAESGENIESFKKEFPF